MLELVVVECLPNKPADAESRARVTKLGDTANSDINLIRRKYRDSIADTNTDIFYL